VPRLGIVFRKPVLDGLSVKLFGGHNLRGGTDHHADYNAKRKRAKNARPAKLLGLTHSSSFLKSTAHRRTISDTLIPSCAAERRMARLVFLSIVRVSFSGYFRVWGRDMGRIKHHINKGATIYFTFICDKVLTRSENLVD
jgi:hypothetical protein